MNSKVVPGKIAYCLNCGELLPVRKRKLKPCPFPCCKAVPVIDGRYFWVKHKPECPMSPFAADIIPGIPTPYNILKADAWGWETEKGER